VDTTTLVLLVVVAVLVALYAMRKRSRLKR
jgi:hypothetical protein